jgi:peptidoglycan/xylan/chitin deacetylase (PgdA/CDA1 family)
MHIPTLRVAMYHYVRDFRRTSFPRIKGMHLDEFRQQVSRLASFYQMATLESALAFLEGKYQPSTDLCLLTFDDGLKEHYTEVTPILSEHKVTGLFFVITSCLEESLVAPVHMNHFLMASLDFETYQRVFLQKLNGSEPSVLGLENIDRLSAQRTYRWDEPAVASFKYFFNFVLDSETRDQVVKSLFEEYIMNEEDFSRALYLNWGEARQMQAAGMVLGGHSHRHQPLSSLSEDELSNDLSACWRLLTSRLTHQATWPFSYPYGKQDSYNSGVVAWLTRLGFGCSFSTEVGTNYPGISAYSIQRLDCKDALPTKLDPI